MFRTKPCSMIFGIVIVVLAHRAVAQDYTIDWHTIGGGGGSGAGGEFKLDRTIGPTLYPEPTLRVSGAGRTEHSRMRIQ